MREKDMNCERWMKTVTGKCFQPQRGGIFIVMKSRKPKLHRSDIGVTMPPRWGFSSFRVTGYKDAAPPELRNGGPRSADLQSAVSQNCILRVAGYSSALECINTLPIANRRYSRVQLCATALGQCLTRSYASNFRIRCDVSLQPQTGSLLFLITDHASRITHPHHA
jgi:hypothetical protein